jgi:hypothetical protein
MSGHTYKLVNYILIHTFSDVYGGNTNFWGGSNAFANIGS